MGIDKKYRYPGIRSFETEDSDIFFGREDDRKKLSALVETEKTVLLYSKSGLGKSSLVKAALIPELEANGYRCYYIRFGLHQPQSFSPVQNILKRTMLEQRTESGNTFLKKFINRRHSLWFTFKEIQVSQKGSAAPVVLVFDQFEEISSYPAKQFTEFKKQLAELVFTGVPQEYQDALKEDMLLEEPISDEELEQLYQPLRVKAIFVIRSDQMSTVNKCADFFPNILKNYYELRSLTQTQALMAIQEPAQKKGTFITNSFSYQQGALDKILGTLSSSRNNEIDSAQLQILLQYIEQDIVEKKQDTDVTPDDLGDLNKVYENYYNNSLKKLKSNRQEAQVLLEDKLIIGGRRISYDKALCLQLVSDDILNTLIETRLIRQEPNTTGGYSYEISHDSLVSPILEAREKRILKETEEEKERFRAQEEAKQKEAYETVLREQRKKQKVQRLILYVISAAAIIAIISGVFAIQQNAKAKEEQKQTQIALNEFIKAEIKRKTLEIDQLDKDANTYVNSGDKKLEAATREQSDVLKQEIKVLKGRIK